jgi:3-hydroxyisobutyrate dehydrogenase-like beta-hydroxyacid dehydrogenase
MDVAVIGLGRMGTGIAHSLLRAGHKVTVYNRTRARAEALKKDGAQVADTIADACRVGIVLTMLADDAAVEAVVFGEGGILASLPRGGIHISSSTISVALSERLSVGHDPTEQIFIAAPVLGRPDAAESGKLFIMAAGPSAAVDKCKPLFDAMGQKVVVLGERPSLANASKLTANFLVANVIESLGEAVAFARKSGVDAAVLLDFLTSTAFNAPIYHTYSKLILEGKHEPAGFAATLGLKDIRLVLQAADARVVPMPTASLLRDRFLTAIARGNQNRDWSVIARVAAEDAGLTATKQATA